MAVICTKLPRLPFAILNFLFAAALAIIGFGVVIAAGYLNTDRFLTSPGPLRKFNDSIFIAMMVAGLTAIIISILGCAMLKIQSLALSRCYGAFIIPVWIILVVCAACFGQLMMTSDKGLESFCNDEVEQSERIKSTFQSYVTDIDDVLVPMASKWMCSKQCSCEE